MQHKMFCVRFYFAIIVLLAFLYNIRQAGCSEEIEKKNVTIKVYSIFKNVGRFFSTSIVQRNKTTEIDDNTTGRIITTEIEENTAGSTKTTEIDEITTGSSKTTEVDENTTGFTKTTEIEEITTGLTKNTEIDDNTTGNAETTEIDDTADMVKTTKQIKTKRTVKKAVTFKTTKKSKPKESVTTKVTKPVSTLRKLQVVPSTTKANNKVKLTTLKASRKSKMSSPSSKLNNSNISTMSTNSITSTLSTLPSLLTISTLSTMSSLSTMSTSNPAPKQIPRYISLSFMKPNMNAYKMLCQNRLCSNTVERNLDHNGAIIVSNVVGYSGIGCGNKQFLFSKSKRITTESAKFCCSYGMEEISFESKEEMLCVAQVYANVTGDKQSSTFIASYFDFNLDRNFTSCNKNAKLTEDMWYPGEPNNRLGRESCLAVVLCPSCDHKAGLRDYPCTFYSQEKVLCQYEISSSSNKK